LYYILTTTLFSELKMITKTAEVTNLVRYSFKYAEDNTQEGIDTAALIIKIAAAVDNGATIAEAVVQHVPPEYQLAAIDDLYKIAVVRAAPAVDAAGKPILNADGKPVFHRVSPNDPAAMQRRHDYKRQQRVIKDKFQQDFTTSLNDKNPFRGLWNGVKAQEGYYQARGPNAAQILHDVHNGPAFKPNIWDKAESAANQVKELGLGRAMLGGAKSFASKNPYAAAGIAGLGLAATGYGAYRMLGRPANTEQQQTPQQQ
jgi:hypothetical protein